MIKVGIVVATTKRLEALYELIYEYCGELPTYYSKNYIEWWNSPLFSIEIILATSARGRRYDLLYYDENINEEIVNEVLYPCCNLSNSRPTPLSRLLMRLNYGKV